MAARSASEFMQNARTSIGEAHVRALTPADEVALTRAFGPAVTAATTLQVLAQPDSVEALQALVRLAAEAGFSVWSRPSAQGNGARAGNPAKPGLLIDLGCMNRILAFDRDSAYALIEPGVSYDQLAEYIAQNDLPFWIDCAANGADSVAGGIIDRAFGYTPYGDHLLMQCGYEVVTANGEVTRTGMGALPGNDTWQLFKYNFGPYLDGLFSRADFGLVSKVGLWMMPTPPAYHPFMLTLPDRAAVGAAVEMLRPLRIDLAIPNNIMISHIDNEAALVDASTSTAPADFIGMLRAGTIATWNLYGALYGLPDNIAAVWETLAPALAALPGARVFTDADQRDDNLWQLRRGLMRGQPAYSKPPSELESTLWCVAAAAPEGEHAEQLFTLVDTRLRVAGIEWRAEFAMTWRTLMLRITVPTAAQAHDANVAALLAVCKSLSAHGYAITHECSELGAAVTAAQTAPGLKHLYLQLGHALDPHAVFGPRSS